MQEELYLSHRHVPLLFGALERYDGFLATILKQLPAALAGSP